MSIADRQPIAFDIFLKNLDNSGMTNHKTGGSLSYCRLSFCQQSQTGKINRFGLCWTLCLKTNLTTNKLLYRDHNFCHRSETYDEVHPCTLRDIVNVLTQCDD